MRQFVEVAFPLPVDSTFTYDVPDPFGSLEVGQRVLAPFGPRKMTGYIVGVAAHTNLEKTKSIEALLDDLPIFTPELLYLAKQMSQLYGASVGESIQVILPPGLIRQTKRKILVGTREDLPSSQKEKEFVQRIQNGKGLDWVTWIRKNPKDVKMIRALEAEGFVRVETILQSERAKLRKKKDPFFDSEFTHAPRVQLNAEQNSAVQRISKSLKSGERESFLLHGITGSGKTEVYLHIAEETLKQGRTVLALVPEIALTPQFVGRFRARFGEKIAIIHSARSESERLADWVRIRKGEATIVIGARSAIFAPLQNIGLIIIDEEHDHSYKQHEGLLYHAKDIAKFRAEKENALLVMGSATPSLETYYASQQKQTVYLPLNDRATGQALPTIQLIDLKEAKASKDQAVFSPKLLEAISETLARNEQVVLFLNRRGFSPSVLCPSCGECLKCTECSVSLTYHQKEKTLLCHYCGKTEPTHSPCRKCNQQKLIFLGMGTEKVEEFLQRHFPDARIERMDRDTVRRKGEHERILKTLSNGKTDILIGTQMVTKGLDFPNVTLVGVLLADQSLHFPNFQAAERTFQLITQVVGRAGRSDKKGEAMIQTFQPEHYAIAAAAEQNYTKFVEQELKFRKESGFPPFQKLVLIELSHKDREQVRKAAHWLRQQAKSVETKSEWNVLGPSPALVEKVDGKSRFHLMLRGVHEEKVIRYAKWLTTQAKQALKDQKVQITLDLHPNN